MKKHILTLVFAILCAVAVFAETKIAVTQSVRYGNGNFAALDTPQISLTKALNEGGKVFFRYDFEITDKGFLDSDIIISVKFLPGDSSNLAYSLAFSWARTTALSGATDLLLDLLNAFKDSEDKQWIQSKIERLPQNRLWQIYEKNDSFSKTSFWAIPLKLKNKKGNKATLEFYIDFKQMCAFLTPKNAEKLCVQKEIPIDITFSPTCVENFAIPNKKSRKILEYFCIYVSNFSYWEREYSSSNRSFTIMVRD